jgi:hypothetical protein
MALSIEVCGKVYGCHPRRLDHEKEMDLIELVTAELLATEQGRRGIM